MNITTTEQNGIAIVEVAGDIDAKTAPEVADTALPLIVPDGKMLLDMSQVPYMSSAGLRMLLRLYKKSKDEEVNGKLVLVGLSSGVKDTMSVTGFLDNFETYDDRAEGLSALA